MRTEPLRPVIDAMAAHVGLPSWAYHDADPFAPGEWLEALILQESAGDHTAVRYEGHADRKPDGDTLNFDDGLFEDDRSYGLMQVMGFNARVLCGVPQGVKMNFTFLLRPLANMAFGLKILTDNLRETGGDVATSLARYNGGAMGNPVGGPFRTQSYVDGVAGHAARVQLARAAANL